MKAIKRIKREFVEFTDAELIAAKGKILVFDIECYSNYFLIAFKCVESDKVVYFELSPDAALDIPKLKWVIQSFCLIGFNSISYDIPIAWLSISGASTRTLKEATNSIILYGYRPKAIEEEYNFIIRHSNHIDLIEVAPLEASLKTYAGRLHCKRMQDLPFHPDLALTKEQAEIVRYYCINDLDNTQLLYEELKPQIALREQMSVEYNQDLRSLSDAQIAESVLSNEIAKIKGHRSKRPKIEPGTSYKYKIPSYIRYKTDSLKRILELVRNAEFVIAENGTVIMPSALDGLEIKIGTSVYRMGIGGLHSSEKCVSHNIDDETLLCDVDVESFYPRIIINQGLYPKHLGKDFLNVYETIVNRRIKAKHEKNKIVADSLKITINGSFGKLGSKYSVLYSPDLMIQVTISGQLSLLMLIERIELVGIPIVSGNTDGIIIKCPVSRYDELKNIVSMWEIDTRFKTEETRYKAVYSRDVNNYIAVKTNLGEGKERYLDERLGLKAKGSYCERGSTGNSQLSKNPELLVCKDAIFNLIRFNTPIEETINNCKDITRFVTVRMVKGGAVKNNIYLGKVIRWYYAKNEIGTINYKKTGNKVPRSEGARPLMDLPDEFPTDIDYQWYINEANDILRDIAFLDSPQKVKQLTFF